MVTYTDNNDVRDSLMAVVQQLFWQVQKIVFHTHLWIYSCMATALG